MKESHPQPHPQPYPLPHPQPHLQPYPLPHPLPNPQPHQILSQPHPSLIPYLIPSLIPYLIPSLINRGEMIKIMLTFRCLCTIATAPPPCAYAILVQPPCDIHILTAVLYQLGIRAGIDHNSVHPLCVTQPTAL